MKSFSTEQLRSVALVGHAGAGKTSLLEAMLYVSGATERQGRVEDGSAVSDFDPEEVRRKMSLHSAAACCEWGECKFHLIDVPGYADFAGEASAALRAVDGALFVAPAQAAAVDAGFDAAWGYARREGVAAAVFINKMDKDNADYFRLIDHLRNRFGKAMAPAELPIGNAAAFHGVVDLIHRKAYTFVDGEKMDHPEGIPPDMEDAVATYREQLIESAAESSDDLIEKYLGGEELTDAEIERGLHDGMSRGKVVPVLCGAATRDMGVRVLLDLICAEFPHPGEHAPRHGVHAETGADVSRRGRDDEPLSLQIFKTVADPYVGKLSYFRVCSGVLTPDTVLHNPRTGKDERLSALFYLRGKQQIPTQAIRAGEIGGVARLADTRTGDTLCERARPIRYDEPPVPEPVYALAIQAKTKTDEDKLGTALHRLEEENPCVTLRRDAETHEMLLVGAGETGLEVVVDRLRRFGAQVETRPPRVPYRETITGHVKAEGRHKKQSGGRGQFGDCWIEIEPIPGGDGLVFVDAIVGGAIPRQYIPAVEKGIREAMEHGVLAGYPVTGVKVTLYDGKYHDVDSSEAAFKIAGAKGFHNAASQAGPTLLEPIMNVAVTVPDEYIGDVMGDLNSRRGRVLGIERMDEDAHPGGAQCVRATIPAREMLTYAIDLRSLTHGRGAFHAELSHYETAPQTVQREVAAAARAAGFTPPDLG